LDAFRISFLYLVFRNVIIVWFGVVFFMFLQVGVGYPSRICRFIFCIKSGSFSANILQVFCFCFSSVSFNTFMDSDYMYITSLDLVPQLNNYIIISLFFFPFLCASWPSGKRCRSNLRWSGRIIKTMKLLESVIIMKIENYPRCELSNNDWIGKQRADRVNQQLFRACRDLVNDR